MVQVNIEQTWKLHVIEIPLPHKHRINVPAQISHPCVHSHHYIIPICEFYVVAKHKHFLVETRTCPTQPHHMSHNVVELLLAGIVEPEDNPTFVLVDVAHFEFECLSVS